MTRHGFRDYPVRRCVPNIRNLPVPVLAKRIKKIATIVTMLPAARRQRALDPALVRAALLRSWHYWALLGSPVLQKINEQKYQVTKNN